MLLCQAGVLRGLGALHHSSRFPDYEFYDYTNNTAETGNDYYGGNAATIAQYRQVLGRWGPPDSGIIAEQLNAPLIGVGAKGKPLSQAQAVARPAYSTYLGNTDVPPSR